MSNKIEKFIEGKDSLNKFAMSLFIVKEYTKKHPYLQKAAEIYLKK